MNIYPK